MSDTHTPKHEYLTTTEVAKLLRVGKHKVLHWINVGRLPAVNTGLGDGTQFIILRRDVDRLCHGLRHNPRAIQ
ncbi:MAG: helix-turn-helix domain-containing protein [Pirellulaceae bacterium]